MTSTENDMLCKWTDVAILNTRTKAVENLDETIIDCLHKEFGFETVTKV